MFIIEYDLTILQMKNFHNKFYPTDNKCALVKVLKQHLVAIQLHFSVNVSSHSLFDLELIYRIFLQ